MAELDLQPSDLTTYTNGRLSAQDPNTATHLNRALQTVRNYCMWKVCPVQENDIVSMDGPGMWGGYGVGMGSLYGGSYYTGTGTLVKRRVGSGTLYLPTKRLQGISSIIEDGVALDLTTLQWSENGMVIKPNNQPWTTNLASPGNPNMGITVTMTHGWSIEEAYDWRAIVLAIADRMSMVKGLIGPMPVNIGPYHVGAFYGTSRAGNLSTQAGWLDDLLVQIDTKRYVIEEI